MFLVYKAKDHPLYLRMAFLYFYIGLCSTHHSHFIIQRIRMLRIIMAMLTELFIFYLQFDANMA